MSTLTILGSDCPGFHHGTKARAVVERGALVQLARFRVNGVGPEGEQTVMIRTALEYWFLVSRAEYAALLDGCGVGGV